MPDADLVHVIDDDEAVRDSLTFLLRAADFNVVAHQSATHFLATLPQGIEGCVITDVRMPDMSGLDLLKRLRGSSCMIPVIVMTGHGDIQLAVEAMKAGAIDFLEKPFDDDRVLTAVRAALDARRAQDERAGKRSEIGERLESLSQRERQVLDGLVAGLPNKTIAHDLGISPRTVEVYRANVMTKMQAGSLSELVRMVLLVQPS
ncbi:response regulator FixJ [Pseudorhodoplanes sp.]|uniref:response regulator FixJ n=1 Tax=Pseudorhodoplanes sp. TaxID=1934341 RepID=UPI002C432885|nr:response regulator FixJ [Pseudorhodoplanes sp.]HWV51061.1 response regulator FixJ [Pseudorhodoplanes sp.]